MGERYQSSAKKSTKKFEFVGDRQLAVRLPVPLVEAREELQPQFEHLTGLAGLKTIRRFYLNVRWLVVKQLRALCIRRAWSDRIIRRGVHRNAVELHGRV